MKKLYALPLFLFMLLYLQSHAQNTGIGTLTPKNTLHISTQLDNPIKDPIRIDSLQAYQSSMDTTFLVVNPDSGVLRYMPIENLIAKSKIFYPPSIPISITAIKSGKTLDLHQTYVNLFSSPMVSSPSAGSLPIFGETELDYYVLDYDTSTFANVSISDQGIMTYDVIAIPASNSAYFNVVFKVR
ncbi:MAG: hypothetical protein AAF696_03955 [Bacteroidota bacterium]